MNRSFAPHLVRPNLPLRKPSSSPVAIATASTPLRPVIRPGATSLSPLPICFGEGSIHPLVIRDKSAVLGSMPQAPIVYPCNFCGQQGHLRCSCCKKMSYCSSACQTKDWLAHRHVCKAADPEPAKEKPKETTVSPGAGDRTGQLETKHGANTPSLQRVYLKDLHVTKINLGTDIQASVVEIYSPGRFFLLAQSPEMLETLQSISTELQKTYSCPTATTYVPCAREVCGVRFSSDLNWYRGLVQTLAADQKSANVLYIDFGNEEHVPVERIRPLAANIQRSCPCALECRIAGVVPLDGSWTAECCIAVKQLLAGQTVTVRPIETLENGRIHVVDVQLPTGKQLKTFLLEHGYATKETVVVPPPTQQEISAMMSVSLENFKRHSSGKDDNSWAHPPEPLTQAVGDAFSVVVTHFQSPTDMIVQKVENAGVIQELQVKLREHCCHVPSPPNFRPAPGTVCCAQFSDDKQWYRAKVLAYPSEERVCVGYVDFGNSEEVDLGHLRPITTSLLALPMQAMPCGLAGVQPVGEKWSDECLMALQRRVSNRILRIEIQGAHEGKVLVTMIDEGSDPQANIAELLISANYAAPAPHPTVGDQQVDQTAVPAAAPQVPAVPTPTTEPMVWSFAEIPSDGQTVALLASIVENPGEFYCRIDNPTDHKQLIELEAELKQHREADNLPFEPKVGEPCCVMYNGGRAWYRALVKELCENLVLVNIADYGFTMKVEKHQLRSITPQLLTLPFQTVRCWLSGVEPLGSEWSSEALLWFQTLVDGEKLSARVLSVTERGYGVELESRGINVASALISEQLAKVPGQITKETHATASPRATPPESTKENVQNQIDAQDLSQSKASAKKPPSECQTTVPSEVPSFPVNWKTVELPLGKTFKPLIVALTSPSLFYVLGSSNVDQQKLQEVMMEVAAFCTNNQACLSSTVLSRPAPGAACCAQFSADNNWYRAVVLEVGDNDMSVVYADYCNTERVPFSRILPIPKHLLQLPFQISRCTLTGKEHFPTEWPEEVQQMFQNFLLGGVLATVQSFDGSANVLSLALPTESGGGDLTAMIVDALQVQAKSKSCPATLQRADQTDSSTPTPSTTAVPDGPQPQSTPETQKGQGHTASPAGPPISPETKSWTPQQNKNISAGSVIGDPVQKIIAQMEPPCTVNAETKDPQTSGCCCLSLKTKIDHLEKLMQQQLSLIELLVAQAR